MRQRVYQALQGFLLAVLLLAGGVAYGQTVTTITVGPDGAQHTKIQDAINAIPKPVTGPVVVEIEPGEYVEKIVLPSINGTSETNTITFRASGDGEVKITYKMDISNSKEGIFTNKACDYVIFERLTFYTEVSTSLLPTNLVALVGGADHNTFRNCHFSTKHDGVNYNGISLLALLKDEAPLDQVNHHLLVDKCHFQGGRFGVYFTAGLASTPQEGCRVLNSSFVDIASQAISGTNVNDLVVEKNHATFTKEGGLSNSKLAFLQITSMAKARIAGNVVRMSTSKANVGIDLGYGNKSTAAGRLVVENNSIYITNKDNSREQTAGISITRGVKFATIRYNSVLIDGSATNTEVRCVDIAKRTTDDLKDLIFENNLFQNHCTNGVVYGLFTGAATLPIPAANMSFSHNAAYSEGKFATVGGEKTADEWMSTAVANETTMVKDKALFADVNVNLKLLNGDLFTKGKPIAEVTTDILGVTRSLTNPTIGAYEYAKPKPSFASGYPKMVARTENSISVEYKEAGLGADVYAVILPATQPAPEKTACAKVVSLIGDKVETYVFSSLQAGTEYKVYSFVRNANGESDLHTLTVSTMNGAAPPVTLTSNIADGDIYADAVVGKVSVNRDAKVYYMVKLASEPAPALSDLMQFVDATGGTVHDVVQQDLEPGKEYKLYTYAKAADGGESPMDTDNFTTKSLVELKVISFNDMTVDQAPTAGNGFRFEGFKVVGSDFPDWEFPQQSAKLEGTEGAVHVATNQMNGAELKGFYLRTKKAATVSLVKSTGESALYTGVVSPKWTYISLETEGPIKAVKLSTEADADLEIDYVQSPSIVKLRLILGAPKAVNDGESQTLQAIVEGAVWPYTVAWSSDKPETLGTELTQNVTTTGRVTYACKVVDKEGNDATGHVTVRTGNKLEVGGFEDLGLQPNSQWKGDPTREMYTHFATGAFSLPNWRTLTYGADFGYANLTATEYNAAQTFETDQLNPLGKGAKGTATWGVLYHAPYAPATSTITLQAGPEGVEVPGIWLTNNSYAYSEIMKGPAGQDPVKPGDFFKVTIKGDNGKAVEYYLADYLEATNANDRYVLNRWAWVDLSPLGKVKSLTFSLVGSRTNAWGQLYPAYVCVDEIGDTRPEKRVETIKVHDANPMTVDLSSYTDLPKEHMKAVIEGESSMAGGVTLSIDGSQLKIEGWDEATEATKEFTVHLNNQGVNEWLIIPVQLTKAIPTYTFAGITIEGEGQVKVEKADKTELFKGNTVLGTENLRVVYQAADGWQPKEPNCVTAQGALLQGDGSWLANADNFTFNVTFELIPPKEYTIGALDWTGVGSFQLLDASGNALASGDKVKEGDLVTIKFELDDQHEIKPENLKVEGLEAAGEQWKVTGDVKISAAFTEKAAPVQEFTVLEIAVQGQGTLELKQADGTVLKANDKVKKDDLLTIKIDHDANHELKPENLKVEGLEAAGEQWKVTGDVKVSATFTEKQVPVEEFTILEITVEGKGTLTLKRADGTVLKVNDKVKKDDLLSAEVAPGDGYELKREDIHAEGLVPAADGKFKVTGNIKVKITFRPKQPNPVEESFATRIYPNPVQDALHIEASVNVESYAVYSLTGNLQVQGAPNASSFSVDLTSLPSGVYMLQLRGADLVRTLRVVKR